MIVIKRIKRGLSAILGLSLTLAFSVNVSAFTDVSGHWAESVINLWDEYGVLQDSDGLFRPDNNITRGEFFDILCKALNLGEFTGSLPVPADLPAGEWYSAPILSLMEAGIVEPFDGLAEPLRPLTRQEQAFYLASAFKITPIEGPTLFTDDSSIGDWCRGHVKALNQLGYLSGYSAEGGSEFRPAGNMARGEAMSLINALVSRLINQPGVYDSSLSVPGNLLVNCPGVTLTGSSIGGSLFIAEAASDITLGDVSIGGQLVILGSE